jgi:uncharacterized protein YfaS (alpha-2-macroglobulin family)
MFVWITYFLLSLALPAPTDYEGLRQRAEASVSEKSFAAAHQLYEDASHLQLSAAERRWVDFRLADTAWRSAAGNGPEEAKALDQLREMIRKSEHDRVWAEANESIGDYQARSYYGSPTEYITALDYWAESDDLPLAKQRYLQIVFKLQLPPRNVVVDALTIATDPGDVAHLRYILATQLLGERTPDSIEHALELLDQVISQGKATEWYDEALWTCAQQLTSSGNVVMVEGEPVMKPDYVKGLALYRRLTTEFRRDETRYYEQAELQIKQILAPELDLTAATTFLPESEQEVFLTWRNVGSVELSIAKVDLTRDLTVPQSSYDVEAALPKEPASVLRQWTLKTSDDGTHVPGNERLHVTPKLESGAYVIYARGNDTRARGLLLVTDTAITAHSLGTRTAIYFSDVVRGAPIAGAHVRMWQGKRSVDATTDANGLATIERPRSSDNDYMQWISASTGERQAYLFTYNYDYTPGASAQWRIYAFTDRPAYRPGETAHWKIIARTRLADEPWSTPAKQTLSYDLLDGRGQKVSSGKAVLNDFGSFWADLPITPEMGLGAFTINFTMADHSIGSATLLRVEEYKLPEYTVSVSTPDQYRLGDTVEASVDARYYFGGPVANATVEVNVEQSTYSPWWSDYSWYAPVPQRPYGNGQNILKQTLRTDANGHAVLRFDTRRDGADSRYSINACVTDESRRQVCSSDGIVVMKQRYRVTAKPPRAIGTPGERISVDFRAIDSKEQGVKTTGKVRVIRRHWEIVKKSGNYKDEEVLTTDVTTNDRGEGTFTFTPQREGYYSIAWSSEDRRPGQPLRARDIVKTETTLWISSNATTDLGYHAGGLELIGQAETLPYAGKPLTWSLLIATDSSGRWVMLTTSAAGIIDTQLVHLDGTVKLVELPVDQRHVPDFTITASAVYDYMFRTQSKVIKVPPEDRLLTVGVTSDHDDYRPRQSGTLTVTTRDSAGRPVPAEVALSVSDESVTAISSDPAGDIRAHFYGESRVRPVNVSSSVQSQRYVRRRDETQEEDGRKKDDVINNGYASLDNVRGGAMAPPPAPVAQAITVTAEAPMMEKAAAFMDMKQTSAVEVVVRSDFRSTAFWKPDVVTDANGTATVKFDYPEALTQWRATARAVTADSKVGMASSTSRTNQPLIVRLQAPRFFVAGDRSVVSAVINNNTDAPMQVQPSLELTGLRVTSEGVKSLDVPAHGEARADWTVAAEQSGTAKLRVSGRSLSEADAMERSLTIYEHGIDKLVARSGKSRGSGTMVRLDLPNARRDTSLVVRVSPSLAAAMLDALPYLIDYPYGCTEQTMSRFLPASIVARTMAKQHLPRPAWLSKLDAVTKQSLARLYDFQHADGGWGWWKDDSSQEFMTAYVVWGFAVAKEGEINVDEASGNRGAKWLDDRLVGSKGDPHAQAWMLHALAAWRHTTHAAPTEPERRAFDDAWTHREKLTPYSRALLALAAHDFGDASRAQVLIRNLENGVKIDRGDERAETMATAHWGADHFWWHWYEGPVETTSFALQALAEIDPSNKLVEPVMNWLVKNRRGARWSNTRDTAIALLGLTDYLRASGELSEPVTYELSVNGHVIGTKSEAESFTIEPRFVKDANDISIRRTSGRGPLYFSVEGRFVSLEEPVTAAGNELFVKREYLRFVPKPTLLKGVVYDKVPLHDGDTVTSGDRIEVVVTIETKNDYEYLLFEDLKPAGLEAVSLTSGSTIATSSTNGSTYVYQELRDRKVALFAGQLSQGTWTIRYELRAETPGTYHALPVLGEAMYVPEIRANGEETHIIVRDK